MLAVALALTCALTWGCADFAAGLRSRTVPVLVVLAGVETSGLVGLVVWVAASGQPFPSQTATLAAVAAGLAGTLALGCFYRALATGTMSIVAPVSSTGVALPVVVGLARGDPLHAMVAAGFVLAFVGVVFASREEGERGEPSTLAGMERAPAGPALGLSLLAALGFGLYFVLAQRAARDSVPWSLVLSRGSATIVVGLVILAARSAAPAARDMRALVLIGVVDAGATSLYAVATRHGALSVVAVLSALYPVVTVVLARFVLHERIGRLQLAGIGSALAGVLCIASG